MEPDRKKELAFVKAPEFRYYAVDAMSVTLSDNSLKIVLGIEEERESVIASVGLHMTHKTAGILYAALKTTIERFEKETRTKFPIPDSEKIVDNIKR